MGEGLLCGPLNSLAKACLIIAGISICATQLIECRICGSAESGPQT